MNSSGIPGAPPDLSDLPERLRLSSALPLRHGAVLDRATAICEAQGGDSRYVACWLHVDEVHVTVPVELRRAVPTSPAGQEGAT